MPTPEELLAYIRNVESKCDNCNKQCMDHGTCGSNIGSNRRDVDRHEVSISGFEQGISANVADIEKLYGLIKVEKQAREGDVENLETAIEGHCTSFETSVKGVDGKFTLMLWVLALGVAGLCTIAWMGNREFRIYEKVHGTQHTEREELHKARETKLAPLIKEGTEHIAGHKARMEKMGMDKAKTEDEHTTQIRANTTALRNHVYEGHSDTKKDDSNMEINIRKNENNLKNHIYKGH